MKRLVVDDCRTLRLDGLVTHVKDVPAAKKALELALAIDAPYDEVWFDHDLGGVYGQLDSELDTTVLPLVYWLEEQAFNGTLYFSRAVIHTMNPVGAKNIQRGLENYYDTAIVDCTPFIHRIEDATGVVFENGRYVK